MSGRVVAVTGASGGIGRAAVGEVSRERDGLALLARGEAGLRVAAEEARAAGAAAVIFPRRRR